MGTNMVVNHLTGMDYRAFDVKAHVLEPPHKVLKYIAKEVKGMDDSVLVHAINMACDPCDEDGLVYTVYYSLL